MNTIAVKQYPFFSLKFVKAYIITMRPYLMFVSGITGIVGMSFSNEINLTKAFLIFFASFLSYGFGQNSRDQKLLTNISFQRTTDYHNSEKIEKVYNFIKENYRKKIKLDEAAGLLNMSVVSFCRFIKQRTGNTFIDFVNEIRLGYATRSLIETNKSISEVCYECGFNNISNFNRIFKKKQGSSPTDFRNSFKGIRNVY